MKELIPRDEYGIFADKEETVRVDSLFVAKFFGKDHGNVIRDIEKKLKSKGFTPEFVRLNFEPIFYKDRYKRNQKAYNLTRDGFVILAMGYNGEKADRFKELYIRRFNEMEAQLRDLTTARVESPELAERINEAHGGNAQHYHYANEYNMINRVALGMDAKKYRKLRGIPEGESIRPYLSATEIYLVQQLQNADKFYFDEGYDFTTRKAKLIAYREKLIAGKRFKALCGS